MAQSAGGSNTISQRIGLEGDDDVVRRLKAIETAVQNIGKNQDALGGTVGAGFSALNTSTEEALNRISKIPAQTRPASEELNKFGKVAEKLKDQVVDLSSNAFPLLQRALGVGIIAVAAEKFADMSREAARNVIEIDNLSKTVGISREAIQGLRSSFEESGISGDLVTDMLNRFSAKMGDARAKSLDLSGALNGNVAVLKGLKDGAGEAGNAVTVLKGKLDASAAGSQLMGQTAVLRGGAAPFKLDLSDFKQVFELVTNNKIANYKDTMEDNQKANEDFLRGLVKLHEQNTSLANAIGASVFGIRKWKQEFAGIEDLVKKGGIEKAIEELRERGLLITPEQSQQAREYTKAVHEVDEAWQAVGRQTLPAAARGLNNIAHNIENTMKAAPAFKEMMGSLFSAIGRGDVGGLASGLATAHKELLGLDDAKIIEGITDSFKHLGSIASEAFHGNFKPLQGDLSKVFLPDIGGMIDSVLGPGFSDKMKTALSNGVADLPAYLQDKFTEFTDWLGTKLSSVWDTFKNTGGSAIDWLIGKASSLGSSVANIFANSATGQAAAAAGGGNSNLPIIPDYSGALAFATGGSVPGSGIGDRVRALLEPGEFVMRRAAVRLFGADFFAALNGGMGDLTPAFATGGMVYPTWVGPSQTAPGSVVQFWLGGDRFDLSAEDETVSRLERKASSERTLRTGRYPGWYPGGAR